MKTILEFIERLGRYVGMIKNVSLLILAILFLISTVNSGCNRKRAEELFERVTGLRAENFVLSNQITEADILIEDLKTNEDSLSLIIEAQKSELAKLKSDFSDLRVAYDDLSRKILITPVEDSYDFLNKVAYPYGGLKKFPFSEPQVKGIHLTWLEHKNLTDQNVNLISQINRAELMVQDFTQMYAQCQERTELMSKNRIRQDEIISNHEEIQEIIEKELRRKDRANRRFKWGAGIGAAAAFVLGLLL